jgi:calcineurin-like phosphoesterase
VTVLPKFLVVSGSGEVHSFDIEDMKIIKGGTALETDTGFMGKLFF